ncbi:MAG: polysaccharide deacetylase family protein [Acidimicrobiales bacterium]
MTAARPCSSRSAGLRPEVALTFHTNGDTAIATALLDRLASRNVAITAFVVGEWLVANPDLGRRIVADGHELANHTWSHLSMGELDRPAIATEIDRCAEAIAAVTGERGRWFRPSAMEVPTEDVLVEAGAAGYATVIGYSVDPLDFTDPGADAIVAGTAVAAPGDIVSLHFGHADTVAAIDPIIDGLAAAGLRPVTVSQLLRP